MEQPSLTWPERARRAITLSTFVDSRYGRFDAQVDVCVPVRVCQVIKEKRFIRIKRARAPKTLEKGRFENKGNYRSERAVVSNEKHDPSLRSIGLLASRARLIEDCIGIPFVLKTHLLSQPSRLEYR